MDTNDPNSVTLEAYARKVDAYLKNTPASYTDKHEPLLRWVNSLVEHAPIGATVLEAGSATGREARYMRSKGLKVQCSDAVQGFVDHLKDIGEDAIFFNLLTDPLPQKYDVVFANAVVQHFSPGDLSEILKKVHNTLEPGGMFAFSAKQGVGDTWVTEKIGERRYMRYWQPDQLYDLVAATGYEIIFLENGTVGDSPNHIWINLTARKPITAQQPVHMVERPTPLSGKSVS